jgi:acetylornithine deacetylase
MQNSSKQESVGPLLEALIGINSVNPSLVPGGAGERQIADYIMRWCAERNIPAEIDLAAPDRPSVIARVKGRGQGRSIILNAHTDTVGLAGMEAPVAARPAGGRVHGRGSYDMKSGLAACMLALADIRDGGLRGDVILTAVSDEEHASIGTQSVLRKVKADAAIVTEPTNLEMVIAHKGFSWHEIITRGIAAHGSRPDLGVDAIAHMGRVLVALEALQRDLSTRPEYPLLRHGSLHASLVTGGQELSSYPDTCVLQVERRTLPTETPAAVRGEIDSLLARLAAQDPKFKAEHRVTLARPSFQVPAGEAIVQQLQGHATEVMGTPPVVRGDTMWMDASLLTNAGIPTVVFGPKGGGAHSINEWVDLASVETCRAVLTRTIRSFCA